MRRAQVLAIGLALAAPAAAHDVPFPEFPDPNVACAKFPEGILRNQCLRENQLGYDEARQVWDRVSEETALGCTTGSMANVRNDRFAYYLFGACVTARYWGDDRPREPAPPFTRD